MPRKLVENTFDKTLAPSVTEPERQDQVAPETEIPQVKKTWWTRIMEARALGGFSHQDCIDAQSWVDCACGEQDPRIERYTYEEHLAAVARDQYLDQDAPKDSQLYKLGISFYDAVKADKFDAATSTLYKIEQRAGELLGESVRVSEVVKSC